MIKKINLVLILTVLVFAFHSAEAALTADTDLAQGKTASGTFSNSKAATDGNDTRIASAVSGNINDYPQFLTIDLGEPVYIQRIKVFWDKDAYANEYDVRLSNDTKSWNTELLKADAGTGAIDNYGGTISQTITGKRFGSASRYVQIYVPIGSRITNQWGKNVKIVEVQVFPLVGQKISIEDASAYVVTDKKAIIAIKTNIGVDKASLIYGLNPNSLSRSATINETGLLTSASIYDLIPDRSYFYKVKVWDYYGNAAESKVINFAPAKGNVALGKRVSGTFKELPPNDPYVDNKKDVLARVTDGGTSYFTSMATSGMVSQSDQYVVIDLGNRYPISDVVTYWRNLAYPQEFSVQVSNDNLTYSNGMSGLDAGRGAFMRSDAGDPMRVLKASLNGLTARYVKILVRQGSPCFQKHADWDFVQLMEVEVIPK